MNRRNFIKLNSLATLGIGISSLNSLLFLNGCGASNKDLFFKISLAQWSLHRTLKSGKLSTLEFPAKTKKDFDIHAVEYVNTFFKDKAQDKNYLNELLQRTKDLNMDNVLIMVDGEGDLGEKHRVKRQTNIENHYKWVEAAHFLNCHAIRVNLDGQGSMEEVAQYSTESLRQLCQFAKNYNINVIVENHGAYSSNANWLIPIIQKVNLPNCGTLPDFGNFYDYDRYQGIKEMMPYAKGVSAKSNHFNPDGSETTIDYQKMLQIVKNANYTGYIGIEYEGPNKNEDQGILNTKKLLLKYGRKNSIEQEQKQY